MSEVLCAKLPLSERDGECINPGECQLIKRQENTMLKSIISGDEHITMFYSFEQTGILFI